MDDLTFWLALWGAALSSYLALREARKDKRQLKIILEYLPWSDSYRIVITNIGHRPVTLEQVNLEVMIKGYGRGDALPRNAFWSGEHERPELPLTLEDGKMTIFYISNAVNDELRDRKKYLDIRVFDAAGTVYSKYIKGEYDQKYGYRSGVYKSPGLIVSTALKVKYWWISRRYKP